MRQRRDNNNNSQRPYFRYYFPVLLVAVFYTAIVLVLDIVFLAETESFFFVIKIVFFVFFIIVLVFKQRLTGRHREFVLIAAVLFFVLILLFSSWDDELHSKLPYMFWLDKIAGAITFIVISIGGIIKMYSDKQKTLRTSNLTGLGNSKWMAEQVKGRMEAGVEKGCLVLIDVRNFRIINSIFGREYGDRLIRTFAELFLAVPEKSYIVAHLGGIEFCVWDENDDKDIIRQKLRVLETDLKQRISESGENVNVFVKSAAAVYPSDGFSFNELLCSANIAMEQTIINEQLSHAFYNPAMKNDMKTESIFIYELQRAIERREFHVFYQKKYCMSGERIQGVEALARWESPILGNVSPGIFIPLVHKAGLTDSFTKLIIEMILIDVPGISMSIGADVQISINIPPTFIQNLDFLDFIKNSLLYYRIDPRRITFEITEDIFIDGLESISRTIRELQKLGIRISLDDFGTGFSSLSYLQNLPIQELKIDKSFIDKISNGENNFILVKAICDIARSNNFIVVAEGVETDEQLELLRQTSCDLIQGYIYSRPEPLPSPIC